MIRIHRPKEPPAVLADEGARRTRALCEAIETDRSASLSAEFDNEVYGHRDVKETLRRAQHDKCAFCESRIGHISYGDVEHFRPKKAVCQGEGDPLEKPGYYWLAYRWENLLLACQKCNQRHKRNLFPLRDPGRRARSHGDDLLAEEPLFIDPAAEDPETLIGFRADIPFPIDDNPRAAVTIESLGLKRPVLLEERRERRIVLERLLELVRLDEAREGSDAELRSLAREARKVLTDAITDRAEYAAMARSLLLPR